MRVLHEQCEKNKSEDKKLPLDSFLVTYKVDDEIKYDVARGGSTVEIFDYYYDKYKKEFKWLKQSKGTTRPNLWNQCAKAPQRRKKKRSSAEGGEVK